MKQIKRLGLLVIAVVVAMAVASPVSASKLTGPSGNETPTIHAHSEGHVRFHNAIAVIECTSTIHNQIASHGTPNTPKGKATITFVNCTNSWVYEIISGGELEWHVTATNTATLTWSGGTFVATRFGVECRYKTENTTIGHVTGEIGTTGHGTIHLSGSIPWHGGSALCGGTGPSALTGSYTTTETLKLDP